MIAAGKEASLTPMGASLLACPARVCGSLLTSLAALPPLPQRAAIRGGNNLHLGGALLNHTNRTVTDEHYNRASSLSAAEGSGSSCGDIKKAVADQVPFLLPLLPSDETVQQASFRLIAWGSLVQIQPAV